VLPFVNMSREKDDEYFSDGITEEVINALANVEGLHVVSRTSAFAFKGRNVSVRTIGEELAVASVLEGSVRREGSAVRITAQLINAADGYHLWSQTYDRELRNVFMVEDELARSIVHALRPRLLKASSQLVRQATASIEAHDLYLRGRHFWNKRTEQGLMRAVEDFSMRSTSIHRMHWLTRDWRTRRASSSNMGRLGRRMYCLKRRRTRKKPWSSIVSSARPTRRWA